MGAVAGVGVGVFSDAEEAFFAFAQPVPFGVCGAGLAVFGGGACFGRGREADLGAGAVGFAGEGGAFIVLCTSLGADEEVVCGFDAGASCATCGGLAAFDLGEADALCGVFGEACAAQASVAEVVDVELVASRGGATGLVAFGGTREAYTDASAVADLEAVGIFAVGSFGVAACQAITNLLRAADADAEVALWTGTGAGTLLESACGR